MEKLRKYKSNDEYIEHQLEKTLNPKTIKSHREKREYTVSKFMHTFRLFDGFKTADPILCIGSRYGEEVEALNNMNRHNVIGIDLEGFPPFTKKMDMHNLEFEDNTFNIIYTNSLDHSINPERAIREMVRVLNKDIGLIAIDIQLHNKGDYEVNLFESQYDIKNIFDKIGIKYGFRDMVLTEYIVIEENQHVAYCSDLTKHVLLFYFTKGNESIK